MDAFRRTNYGNGDQRLIRSIASPDKDAGNTRLEASVQHYNTGSIPKQIGIIRRQGTDEKPFRQPDLGWYDNDDFGRLIYPTSDPPTFQKVQATSKQKYEEYRDHEVSGETMAAPSSGVKDRIALPTIDMRMQEEITPKSNAVQSPNPVTMAIVEEEDEEEEDSEYFFETLETENPSPVSKYLTLLELAKIHQAFCRSSSSNLTESLATFPAICSINSTEGISSSPAVGPISAFHLDIPRLPLRCPDTKCNRLIFVSDFCKHFLVDHTKLPLEQITPLQCMNFSLDPSLTRTGFSTCNLVLFVCDKIRDLGTSECKDFLPLLVMSTRIGLLEMCNIEKSQFPHVYDEEFLMVWVAGFVPDYLPTSVSLAVWSCSQPSLRCNITSTEVYSVRNSQCATDVYKSGQMLLFSVTEVEMMTNGFKDMLALQICVQ